MFDSIIDPDILFNNLHNPNWVVIDCRFDLSNPSWGYEEYCKDHVPNAFFADLEKDLSSPKKPGTGRHPLPGLNQFTQKCSSWGIETGKQVVVYDSASGAFSGRLWWMLRYLGHNDVAILNGGYTAWKKQFKPITVQIPVEKNGEFNPNIQPELLISSEALMNKLHQPNLSIIDSRAINRYLGLEEPLDKIAGHIPTAVNRFHQENLSKDGYLLTNEELSAQFAKLLGKNLNDQEIVVYCGSGVTSCLNIAALHQIGVKNTKLYLGSWSEWIEDPHRPIITKK